MHFLKSFVVFVLSESPKSLRNPLLESSEVKPFRNLLNESSEPKILPEILSGRNPRFWKSSDRKSPESSIQIPLHMKRPTPGWDEVNLGNKRQFFTHKGFQAPKAKGCEGAFIALLHPLCCSSISSFYHEKSGETTGSPHLSRGGGPASYLLQSRVQINVPVPVWWWWCTVLCNEQASSM